MPQCRIPGFVLAITFWLLPLLAAAQQTAGISGVVRDSSGAVLPGVTVEAASPALLEKVRTAVSDGEGRYTVIEIPPGTYTVTFTLTGFGTFTREGVTLASGFTATVDATMRVGALEESITVSGAAPLVDTQNVRKQLVASAELLSALPTSSKQIYTLVTLTPGYAGVPDVGGQYASEAGAFHGKRGTRALFNGMGVENSSGNSSYQINAATVEEMVLQTSGISAEVNADGPIMNIIPKSGSNTFQTIFNGLYSNHAMESDNLSDELRGRGLKSANQRVKIFDEAASLGGPIKRDKIWFFGAYRTWGMAKWFSGVYYNRTQDQSRSAPGAPLRVVPYTPWLDRPLDTFSARWEHYDSASGRVTWQAAPKHKIDFFIDRQYGCNCGSIGAADTVETYIGSYKFEPNRFIQVTYNSPLTPKLLIEAGYGASISQWNQTYGPNVTPDIASVTDVALGVQYGSSATYRGRPNFTNRKTQRASLTYVTGGHNFKTGIQTEQLATDQYLFANGNMSYTFRAGVPIALTQRATPFNQEDRGNDYGAFVQDQWRIRRLTLNLGVRYDHYMGWVPEQNTPGETASLFDRSYPGVRAASSFTNQWIGPRRFAKVTGIPSWHDINPRVGFSYDLFGTGRTAIKASAGRYVAKTNVDVPQALNPITTSVNAATRAWNDTFFGAGDPRSGNFSPDCDLGNFLANGECGALNNQNFGRSNPNATTWSDAVRKGWGVRDNNWDYSAEIQHEVRRGLSTTFGYYRNTGGYFRNTDSINRVTDNVLVTGADFDTYCVTAPNDPRLPNGGGYQVCGMADIKPGRFGQVLNEVKATSDFGKNTRYNDFFTISIDGRFRRGARLGGGFDTGRSVNDTCFNVDAPGYFNFPANGFGALTFGPQTGVTIDGKSVCRIVTPFKAQTQVKLNGSLPLKSGFVFSGVYQDLSGTPVEAVWAAPTAAIAPSLGRNLAGGALTANVPLLAPNTIFEGRIRRLDLRLTKFFQLTRRVRLQANLDAYNALNSSAIQSIIRAYGTSWRQPNTILDARILQVSGQLTF
ncbi:MAG: TonB-dependent receptor [Acidimicrobiia bacterium]|nr:TonB-dependent receptor [Acidimicrobiia bacterium]